MPIRELDPKDLGPDEDWVGSIVSFLCPHCEKVFIVSRAIHGGERKCPVCFKSTGRITKQGGRNSGARATIEW